MSPEIENRESRETIKEKKNWSFEKINKVDKPLARLRKKEKRHKLLISEKKEGLSLLIPWTSKDKKEYYEQLYDHRVDNPDEMDQFLERHSLPKSHEKK